MDFVIQQSTHPLNLLCIIRFDFQPCIRVIPQKPLSRDGVPSLLPQFKFVSQLASGKKLTPLCRNIKDISLIPGSGDPARCEMAPHLVFLPENFHCEGPSGL